jgi:hypothetical protein
VSAKALFIDPKTLSSLVLLDLLIVSDLVLFEIFYL